MNNDDINYSQTGRMDDKKAGLRGASAIRQKLSLAFSS
jgi:hypothetical protein